MKHILCYGDSNTWGYIPGSGERYSQDIRWPMQLQKILGDQYMVIEEGLNGRTTVIDDPVQPYRCGLDYLHPCLLSHQPLDTVIILLGTNDTKKRFSLSASEIARGLEQLVRAVQHSGTGPGGTAPRQLVLSPPLIGTYSKNDDFEGAAEKSLRFAAEYSAIAEAYGCAFLDTGRYISAVNNDGVHLTAEQHRQLAILVGDKLKKPTV